MFLKSDLRGSLFFFACCEGLLFFAVVRVYSFGGMPSGVFC